MPPCISPDYFTRILDVVLPQVDVLLQGIVLWVVLRLRSTSQGELQTLSSLVTSAQRSSEPLGNSESRRAARVRKKL
jgi:hypothetical protein